MLPVWGTSMVWAAQARGPGEQVAEGGRDNDSVHGYLQSLHEHPRHADSGWWCHKQVTVRGYVRLTAARHRLWWLLHTIQPHTHAEHLVWLVTPQSHHRACRVQHAGPTRLTCMLT